MCYSKQFDLLRGALLSPGTGRLTSIIWSAVIALAFSHAAGTRAAETTIPNDGSVPSDVVVADFNCDGQNDLVVSYAFDDQIRWFENAGDGVFVHRGSAAIGTAPGTLNDLPREMTVNDFDADGFLDLVVVSSGNPNAFFETAPSVGVMWGAPEFAFEPFEEIEAGPPGSVPTEAPEFSTLLVSGLIDRDKMPDFIVGHFGSKQVSVVRKGPGREWRPPLVFDIETEGLGPRDLKLADLNFDGVDDLIVTNETEIQLWRSDGFGGFGLRTTVLEGEGLTAAAPVDLNRDGVWDLAALDAASGKLIVLMGIGEDGTAADRFEFNLLGGDAPVDLVVYDANLDGIDDLAVVFLLSANGEVWLGTGDETGAPIRRARRFETGRRPRAIKAADLNGDGRPDLVTANEGDQLVPGNDDVTCVVNDLRKARLPRVVVDGASVPGAQISPYMNRPVGLGWDAARGGLWIADRKDRGLILVAPDGGVQAAFGFGEIIPSPAVIEPWIVQGDSILPPLFDPADAAADGEGRVWLADRLGSRLIGVDGTTGAMLAEFSTRDFGQTRPSGVAYDPSANQLLIGDERDPVLVVFPLSSLAPQTLAFPPVRDLAFDPVTDLLFAVPAGEPGAILMFSVVNGVPTLPPIEVLPGAALAPLFANVGIDGVAVDPAGRRLWLLMAGGLLAEVEITGSSVGGDLGFDLIGVRELRLLREIRGFIGEPGGGMLLADGGLLGTLVRIDANGDITQTIELNDPLSFGQIDIQGITRGPEHTYVLDGNGARIRQYDSAWSLVGNVQAMISGELRARGLHLDPSGESVFVGSRGSVAQLALNETVTVDGTIPAGGVIGDLAVPVGQRPGSISGGRQPGELAVYSPDEARLIVARQEPAAGPGASNRLGVIQTDELPSGFRPLAMGPLDSGSGPWIAVGSGEPTLLRFSIQGPPSDAGRSWTQYP